MFSPQPNGAPATLTRTTKRRLRANGGDSINGPKTKKARMTVSDETFIPPDPAPEMEETRNHKVAALPRPDNTRDSAPGAQRDMALRGGRPLRSTERVSKGDGTSVLTTNDTYTVSRLPALPDVLRLDATVHQHGSFDPDTGYALALTHTQAIVWPYAVNSQSPESHVFTLPHPSKHVTDPLPLGSLVSPPASSTDPGLVVVIPSSGKITYWESAAAAATLDLRMKRNGVESSIPGMISGEIVIQIVNAESAGFLLAFSTGRIAYMSVRDGQGRAAISVQFLRSGSGILGGGLFGSLRNVLSSSALRGDIAAVRAARPERVGERSVVLATTKGKIQSWNIHRGGHATVIGEAESREAIVTSIKATSPALSDLLVECFEIHDFTFTPKTNAESQLSDHTDGVDLLVLVSMAQRDSSHYFLVEVVLKQDGLVVASTRPVTSYTTPVSRYATSKPRLFLPYPAIIAYVVFDRAIVVISMAKQPDSPDLQLRSESHIQPPSFEDVIDFRQEMNVEIVGSNMEELHRPSNTTDDLKSRRHKVKNPAAILLVRGGGVLRVAATDLVKLSSSDAQQVTAKSKIEQAVFFGNLEQNPLSFTARPELQFTSEEIGAAALELSQQILKSESPHIKDNLAVDKNLKLRTTSLRDLAKYVKACGASLDRITKWRLLWDAEKIAAATVIWKHFDASIRAKPEGKKRGLMNEIVEYIHENYKTEPIEEAGELDRVRHWFIKDIWNLEMAFPWAFQVMKITFQDGQKDHAFVMNMVSEANDILVGGLQAAFDFRADNLDLYSLGKEKLEHGILKAGYEEMQDSIWTSTHLIAESLRKQTELAGVLLSELWDRPVVPGGPDNDLLKKTRDEFPALLDITIRSNLERVRWGSSQEDKKWQEQANQTMMALQSEIVGKQIGIMAADLALADESMVLAEKHELLNVLAKVLHYELMFSLGKLREPGLDDEELSHWNSRSRYLQKGAERWFSRFGGRWAEALFEHEISVGSMAELLDNWKDQQHYLTTFLRSKPEYAKISWINDITKEEDFGNASATLLDLGLIRESEQWSKKVELSVGKMAFLASRARSPKDKPLTPDESKIKFAKVHNQLGLIKIQEQVYEVVRPSIEMAIDENAELQLALESHGNKALREQPVFTRLLADSMELLIKHEAMDAAKLIDLLTLIGDHQAETYADDIFQTQRFYFALQASRYGTSSKDDRHLKQRIIWRRCMLADNWSLINNTTQKDDKQVQDLESSTILYQTFKACFKNRLFDKNTNVKAMNPREILVAGTEELEDRFTSSDASTQESILKDMQLEEDFLELLMEKHRLEKWYETIYDRAEREYEEALADETEDGNKMQEAAFMLDSKERELKRREEEKSDGLLHSKPRFKPKTKLNGRSSTRQAIMY
ncbi:uncharacterized protein L3040_001304 [Drepanopeziza brunnea f. sp. 'multigermtubi']|uniref:uncharacterized protein n=1 Tax=Drepanopeziza brunnea f. sp. 'multigermtubi' TaxID=698441 RepID=UPI0023983898|nr:hypothetical protein L3040_001304 [Drepanopeziza brunnea f. sp. 'multigermtubi']